MDYQRDLTLHEKLDNLGMALIAVIGLLLLLT